MNLSFSLAPEALFYIGSLPITNALLWSFLASLFIVTITLAVRFRLKEVPGNLQNVIEILFEGGYDFVKSTIGDEKKAKRAFPLVFTMFIFILTANLSSYLPGMGAFKLLKESGNVSLFRVATSDYALVFVLTMISIITIQFVAIFTHGPFGYIKKFINFSSPLAFALGLMDIVGELAKILSLSFRLFGNMFAGEVLGAVMLALAPFFIPLPFAFLGLITAVIQAFVFSLLTLIFISMASTIEENETLESVSP